ncbi:MAG: lysophospholipid acyltransferase family protein [Caulobacteraceae bacterium]|nr:lysophospholipid acyltransferase family protein [Caulobacteraceae bacterium]
MIWFRSLLFVAAFYLWSTIAAFLMVPTLVMPRAACAWALRAWGRVVTLLLRLICGVRVEVRGRQHLPTGPALIASKHQCMFDIFGAFAFLPDSCFISRKEFMRIPFVGWYIWKSRMIVIDREGQAKALKKMVADSRDRLKHDRQIVIFPEGHRGEPGEAGDYKPGVAALYRELDMPCTLLALNTGVHWPAHGFLRKPGTIVFEFLEPIPAGLKRAEFMRTLQDRLETASNALLAEGL